MTTRRLTVCAAVAAIYIALTFLLAPISYGPIQCRVSEALCVLPFVSPYTGWGLFVGCLLSNLFNPAGVNLLDVVFGSLATLIAALMTARARHWALAPLPAVLVNAVVIGAVLAYTTAPQAFAGTFVLFACQIAVGQVLSCYVLGLPLLYAVRRTGIAKLLR